MHQQQCEIAAKPDQNESMCMCVKLQHELQCDTYTGRLVLGEHTPGVIVEVVFVGGMLCLTEAVDKL